MASYRLLIKRSAEKELLSIGSKRDRQRLRARILALTKDPLPPGCKKISLSPFYRLRQGRFRIIYALRNDVLTVLIVRVADRKKAYR